MRYELGMLGTGVGVTTAQAEVRAGTAAPMSVLELGLFLNAATATTITVGRPGNTPVGGTIQTASLPTSLRPGGGASLGGLVLSGWSTAPTVPAAGNSTRMIALPAAIGNGIVFTWQIGEMIIGATNFSQSLILWNVTANSALRMYMKWDE